MARPCPAAAARPRSGSPTTAIQEPVAVARTIMAMARERAPTPDMPIVMPRRSPPGNSPARAGSTGRARSTARTVGRVQLATSPTVGTDRGRDGSAPGSARSSSARSSNGSGSASREAGNRWGAAMSQYRTYVRYWQGGPWPHDGGGSACWRIQACIAMPDATPALIDRVDPYWAIEQTIVAASRTS